MKTDQTSGADALPSEKQEKFAQLVASGVNHSEARRRAGYKQSKHADSHAARLADLGSISARIEYLRALRTEMARAVATVDATDIQAELEALAFSDIADAFEAVPSGDTGEVVPRVLPVDRWPKEFRAAVAKVKARRYTEGSGDSAREVEVVEFTLWNKVNALHELREHMGLVGPKKVDLTVRGVVALPVLQVPVPGPGDRIIDVTGDSLPDLEVATPQSAEFDAARLAALAALAAWRARER